MKSQIRETEKPRRPYQKPQLQAFGFVRDLTQASTSGSTEAGTNPACENSNANTLSTNCP
jgi:hypothetical protein